MVSYSEHLPQGVLSLSTSNEQGEADLGVVQQLPIQGEHVEVDKGGQVVHSLGKNFNINCLGNHLPFSQSKLQDLNDRDAQSGTSAPLVISRKSVAILRTVSSSRTLFTILKQRSSSVSSSSTSSSNISSFFLLSAVILGRPFKHCDTN